MERYLVYTTDEIAKRAIDPTRVFAVPQPQSPSSEAPVEKVGLTAGIEFFQRGVGGKLAPAAERLDHGSLAVV